MGSLTIPCADCDDTKARLELRHYEVTGCDPTPGRDGFCTISFIEPPTPSEHAMKLAAAQELPRDVAGSLTSLQARTAKAIVNIFETGAVLGVYGQVTLISGDSGHLTYGRSQTTLGSGNLYDLILRYCTNPGARFSQRLSPYLERLRKRDLSLDTDGLFANLLRAASDDPVMRGVQDGFFDDVYWVPALAEAQKHGLRTALGTAVVYDSVVHGSWNAMRLDTDAAVGDPSVAGEPAWIAKYIQVRRNWLATNARADLRPTVYRMDALRALVDQGRWGLSLPLVVRQHEISQATLDGQPPGCYDGPAAGSRSLALSTPLLRGLDVRLVQLGLSERQMSIVADGIFGQASQKAIETYQIARGLAATGVADAGLIAELVAS